MKKTGPFRFVQISSSWYMVYPRLSHSKLKFTNHCWKTLTNPYPLIWNQILWYLVEIP